MRWVSNRHDKAKAVYESQIASHVDYEAIKGSRRNRSRWTGFLSKSDKLWIWYAD